MVVGCTACPYAGHIELKECPDAYTDKAPGCNLYSTEPLDNKPMYSSVFIASSSIYADLELFTEYYNKICTSKTQIYCKKDTRIAKWLKYELKPSLSPIYVEYDEIPEVDYVLLFWDQESHNIKELIDKYPNAEVVTFENTSKKAFFDELNKIQNEKWREGCMKLTEKLPDYFWVVSASVSMKHHPTCDLGMGGLLRHSTMVSVVGEELLRSEVFMEDTDLNKDLVRIACLFHDSIKQGWHSRNQTEFNHPVLSAQFVKDNLADYVEEEYLSQICSAIETHNGKWNTSDNCRGVILRVPETPFEKLVHMADYTASRSFIGDLDSWVYWHEKHRPSKKNKNKK